MESPCIQNNKVLQCQLFCEYGLDVNISLIEIQIQLGGLEV